MNASDSIDFNPPTNDELQELLPGFTVVDFIAKGGMGAVYRAREDRIEREVAIKILPSELSAHEELRNTFAAEARAMARLHHPNLVRIHDFGEAGGQSYLVMEYVNGKALHYSAHGHAIEQEEALRLALGICRGLAHAHNAGVVHRDIKPANILLDGAKQPKIGDFGLAGIIGSDEADRAAFGSPGYSAPEVLRGAGKAGKQADVYSVGVILYELLTGSLPGDGYEPASRRMGTDPRLDVVITRALHPLAMMRFPDAGRMAEALEEILADLAPVRQDAATALDQRTSDRLPSRPAPRPLATPALAPVLSPAHRQLATGTAARPPFRPRPVALSPSAGPNWPLWRNVTLILTLLLAIYGMVGAIRDKKERIQRLAHPPAEELTPWNSLTTM